MKLFDNKLLILLILLFYFIPYINVIKEKEKNKRIIKELLIGGSYKGHSLLHNSTIDSLMNLRADTVSTIDTVYLDKVIEIDRPIPNPTPLDGDSSVNIYVDDVLHPHARFVITDHIRGYLVKRDIEYTPYMTRQTIRQPYPVFLDRVILPDSKRNIQVYGGVMLGRIYGVEAGGVIDRWKIGYIRAYNNDISSHSITVGRVFNFN